MTEIDPDRTVRRGLGLDSNGQAGSTPDQPTVQAAWPDHSATERAPAAEDASPTETIPAADRAPAAEDASLAETALAAEKPHAALGLSDEDVMAMYRQVLIARAVDERMWLMQRAGKIAFIISVQGHEVAQVGISWPLRKGHDWMAPFYRSIAAAMTFGMTPEDIITAHLAKGDDISSGGRQMPGHYGAAPHNILSVSSPVGTQVLHAVGLGLGAWVRGDDAVAITQFGEGTANQGEVHEAMNFAGVHRLPVIFVCENNGYAISVPLERQVGGGSVAARAAGYGFPGVEVDGGDLLACYAAGREAHERARTGGGPTLIEAHVVRLTSHSSDDDQRRYREAADVEGLKERDPIPRLAASLREWGLLDDAADAELRAEMKALVAEAAGRAEAHPDPDPSTIFRHVYADGGS